MPLNSPICDTPVVDPHITSETLAGQTYLRLHRALMTGGLLPEQVLIGWQWLNFQGDLYEA